MKTQKTLVSETAFRKLVEIIVKYRYVILGTLITGFLAYTYLFTNKIPNHDDLLGMFGKGSTVSSGRFGLGLMSYVFPDISMPWIYGVLTLIIITVGNCLLVKIFQIQNTVLQFLLGGIIVSFPSQIGTMAYMFTATSYAVAYVLSILAVYFIVNAKQKRIYILIAALCLVGTLSIYQAYLSITVSVLILYLVYELLNNQGNARELFIQGIAFVCFLLFSLILYYSLMWLTLSFNQNNMNGYASSKINLGKESIFSCIKKIYETFYLVFRYRRYNLVSSRLSLYLHPALCILSGLQILIYMLRNKNIAKTALMIFLLAVLPMGINCILLIVKEGAVHTLTCFAYISLYLLFALLVEHGQFYVIGKDYLNKLHSLSLECIVVGMALIAMGNVYRANEAALGQYLSYENLLSFTTSAMTQVQQMPEYTPETKISCVGNYEMPAFYSHFNDAWETMGYSTLTPNTHYMGAFMEYYTGFQVNWVDPSECIAQIGIDQFNQLPCYPERGSIAYIDDIIVIKVGNELSQ